MGNGSSDEDARQGAESEVDMQFVNFAFTQGKFRLNSWYAWYRRGDDVVKATRDCLGKETLITVYRRAGWNVDWQGNATRVWEIV